MKKITLILSALLFVMVTSCEVESIDQDLLDHSLQVDAQWKTRKSIKPKKKFDIPEQPEVGVVDLDNLGEVCTTVKLIAGQHHVAGDVNVYVEGDNLIIIYDTSNTDWTIGKTHLQIGDCEDGWVPLSGGGSPKNGHFQYTEPYSATDNEIVYVIPLDTVPENYCFAAHAEVQGPTGGETAWGEGLPFEASGWAMYVESSWTDCVETDDEDDDCCIPV